MRSSRIAPHPTSAVLPLPHVTYVTSSNSVQLAFPHIYTGCVPLLRSTPSTSDLPQAWPVLPRGQLPSIRSLWKLVSSSYDKNVCLPPSLHCEGDLSDLPTLSLGQARLIMHLISQAQKVASKWPKYLDHSMTSELISVVLKADADMAWLGS